MMKLLQNIFFIIFVMLIYRCGQAHNPIEPKQMGVNTSSLNNDQEYSLQLNKKETIDPYASAIPVFGYRFVISGDFNGDGKEEKLIEHYVGGITHTEINKFYEGLSDYGDLVVLICNKQPVSFVVSDNHSIDTLLISDGVQQLGLALLKNEGDLDGDGGDEISYVVNWADWSNLNTWYIMTYKNNKWRELYSFDIWDWQLLDLPETTNQYGLFGLENEIVTAKDKKDINNKSKN